MIGAPRAKAQDPDDAVTLQFRFARGDHWSIDEDLTMHLALTVSTGSAAESAAQSNHRVRRGDLTVLEAEPGRLAAVRVRFGGECLDTEQVGDGELVRKPTALAGQSLTVTRKAGGEPSLEGAMALSDDEKQEARVLLDPSPGLFPAHAVRVGDRWATDEHALPPALAKVLSIEPGDSCALRLLLKELGDVDGRRVAGLGAELVVDQKREGSTTKYELAGAIVLDVAKGIALAIDLHGTVGVAGHAEQAGENGKAVQVSVVGKGDIRYRSGMGVFAAEVAPAAVPVAGATSFGHMRFTAPPGWKSTTYANGVLLQPTDLPPGGHLDVTVMQALEWSGTLDDALKRSWDDAAAQLGLGKTMTVDGTPYMKRQSGTSFQGWEYVRGDGALRSANGDYYAHLFLVRVHGRVERLLVASKEKSYRGESSSYMDPRYYDGIQRFLFSVQFDDWKDPVVAPATLRGDGIVGVWAGLSMTGGTLGGAYAIFFANGQAYFASKFPIHGLDGLDTWVDREMRPRYWGTWSFQDGKGLMKLIYQEVPLREAADVLVLTTLKTDHKYVKVEPPDGARFDGTWAFEGESGKPKAAISFTPGGGFKDYGAVNVLNHGYPLTEAPGEGTYEVRGYTLVLHFRDGREYRIAFPGLGYEKGDLRPQRLILSFNEDALIRQ